MIKGIRIAGTEKALSYLDTLIVPIIENTPFEEDLKDSMAQVGACLPVLGPWRLRVFVQAMKEYPNAAAVLVRRHGIYVWGKIYDFQ